MVDGLAVDDGAGTGRVVAHHAAEVGPAGGGYFRPEKEVVRGEGAVECVEDDAGLDAGRAAGGVNIEDLVKVLAAIEDDAGADRLTRQARSSAARRDRHVHLGGDLHGGDDVLGGLRDDDAERLDLVDAGVGAVEAARGEVEADLAGQVLAQVAGEVVAAEFGEVGHGACIVSDFRRRGKAPRSRAAIRKTMVDSQGNGSTGAGMDPGSAPLLISSFPSTARLREAAGGANRQAVRPTRRATGVCRPYAEGRGSARRGKQEKSGRGRVAAERGSQGATLSRHFGG